LGYDHGVADGEESLNQQKPQDQEAGDIREESPAKKQSEQGTCREEEDVGEEKVGSGEQDVQRERAGVVPKGRQQRPAERNREDQRNRGGEQAGRDDDQPDPTRRR
jgi:hypothetical protein